MEGLRVLVVDDFASFRECVCALLEGTQFRVVGQAADGLEAVEKAQSCQPDLILLDIGLPNLNGLEVATRVRTLAPAPKILFFSVDSDIDLVREALSLGAGYIHKPHVQSGLLPAIEAVLRGEQFVDANLESSGRADARRHEVQFYSSDSVLLESFVRLLATALESGGAAIVLATKSHREGLVQRLQGEGFASAAKASNKEHPRVAICGECVGLLYTLGNTNAAIRLEKAGNDLVKSHNVDIACAYPLSNFHNGRDAQAFQSICAEHTAVNSH